jgi:hypothetical protein
MWRFGDAARCGAKQTVRVPLLAVHGLRTLSRRAMPSRWSSTSI